MSELKNNLRKQLVSRRKEMNPEKKVKADNIIFEKLILTDEFINSDLILSYVSTEIEVNTQKLINYCFETGKAVATPVSLEKDIIFKIIKSWSDLELGKYNIYEPIYGCEEVNLFQNSICIVPALSVSEEGYRIGYGKGYYDRFLSKYSGLSICVCYSDFIGYVPFDKYDIKPDMIITDV